MRMQIDLTEREKQNQKKTEVKETDPILKAFKDVQNQVSTTSQFNFGAKKPKATTKVTLRSHQLEKCNQLICSSATSFYMPTNLTTETQQRDNVHAGSPAVIICLSIPRLERYVTMVSRYFHLLFSFIAKYFPIRYIFSKKLAKMQNWWLPEVPRPLREEILDSPLTVNV